MSGFVSLIDIGSTRPRFRVPFGNFLVISTRSTTITTTTTSTTTTTITTITTIITITTYITSHIDNTAQRVYNSTPAFPVMCQFQLLLRKYSKML